MIDRLPLRVKLCRALQTEYVALLGQRGIGVKTALKEIAHKSSPFPGMKFISITLSPGVQQLNEFKEIFLRRLVEAATSVPPEAELTRRIAQTMQEYTTGTVDLRIRMVIDSLGKGTTANYLVIILHAFAEVPEEPLKNLLLMLREYHDQVNYRGEAGEKLRFLVAGDARLWHLCYHKTKDQSPFNIAQRIFLGGLSPEEIQELDNARNFEAAVKIRDLTDGIPSLVEQAINGTGNSDDLAFFFKHLQDRWTSLPLSSQELLKRLATGSEHFPHCVRDYGCPEVPVIDPPWMEAFWGGFLRMRHHELVWRSPIHKAFAMEHVYTQIDTSKTIFVKADLLDRAEHLARALKHTEYSRDWDESIGEALSLAVQTDSAELSPILEMVQSGAREDALLEQVKQLAENSERGWIQDLAQRATQHKKNISGILIEGIVSGTKRSWGNFDVFLCHNSDDKPEVKKIAGMLQKHGILPWLDEWELRPGVPWLPKLEQQIERVKSAAVFVGKNGLGPWQTREMYVLLREFVNRGCPVIPVLLADAPERPKLPIFLSEMTWVDFQKQEPDPMKHLIWGITGEKL